jgi:hypothetical protein
MSDNTPMTKVESLEREIRSLTREEAEQLQNFLADFLEEDADLTPEFIASIDRGKTDLAEGQFRVREATEDE